MDVQDVQDHRGQSKISDEILTLNPRVHPCQLLKGISEVVFEQTHELCAGE